MALHDDPPHRVTTYTSTTGPDAGGGTGVTYTQAQAAVPCSIDTASASEVAKFAAQQIAVTHKVGFLASVLRTPLTRGMKLVAGDTGASFHVKGIATGRAYGSIPAFMYAFCEEML